MCHNLQLAVVSEWWSSELRNVGGEPISELQSVSDKVLVVEMQKR